MEKEKTGKTGKTKLRKPGGSLYVDGKLSDSSRSNGWHNRMGPQGGEGMEYMDEAKMGNYTIIRKQVLTETTVGVWGGLYEKGKQ